MEIGEKEVKKLSLIALVLILTVLAFLVVKPFVFSIIGGLFLAYVFYPVYLKIGSKIKNKSLVASIVSIIIVLVIFAFLWFVTPLLVKQFFDVYLSLQKLDFQNIIKTLFPTASDAIVNQLTVTLNSALSNLFANISTFIGSFISEIPKIVINFFVLGFVFFFALRDSD